MRANDTVGQGFAPAFEKRKESFIKNPSVS